MDYDDILKHLGEFGRYQKLIYVMVWFSFMPTSIHICNIVFLTQEPVYRCAVPGLTNDTFHIQNEAHQRLVNASIPYDVEKHKYTKCSIYDNWDGPDSQQTFSNKTVRCDRWVYDEDTLGNSMIPDINVPPCDRKKYKVNFGLAVMIGLLAGSTFGGVLSDYFGRKKVLVVAVFVHFVLSIAFTFVTSLEAALVIKFCQAALGFAGHMSKFVLIVEITGPRMRGVAAMATMLAWSLAMCLIAGVYYLCQDWKTAQLVLTIPYIFCIPFSCLVPESPRWLLVHNKVSEAKRIIAKMARINRVSIPEELVDSLEMIHPDKKQSSNRRNMILQLFKDKIMILRLIVLGVNWGIANISYYGLTLNMGSLAGKNVYLAMLSQGIVESVAFMACTVTGRKLSRKLSYCVMMVLGGTACLVSFILGVSDAGGRWINLTLFSVGKFGVGAAFTLVYTMSTELIPTASRNFGLGLCSVCGRIFGISAPYIANMKLLISGRVGEVSPLAIFGGLAIIAGLSIFLLPETQNKHLPESIKDIKRGAKEAALQEEEML